MAYSALPPSHPAASMAQTRASAMPSQGQGHWDVRYAGEGPLSAGPAQMMSAPPYGNPPGNFVPQQRVYTSGNVVPNAGSAWRPDMGASPYATSHPPASGQNPLSHIPPERLEKLKAFMSPSQRAALFESGAVRLSDVAVAKILSEASNRELESLLACATQCRPAHQGAETGSCIVSSKAAAQISALYPEVARDGNRLRISSAGQPVNAACRVNTEENRNILGRVQRALSAVREANATLRASGNIGAPEARTGAQGQRSLHEIAQASLGFFHPSSGPAAAAAKSAEGGFQPLVSVMVSHFQVHLSHARAISRAPHLNDMERLLTAALYGDFMSFVHDMGRSREPIASTLESQPLMARWVERLANFAEASEAPLYERNHHDDHDARAAREKTEVEARLRQGEEQGAAAPLRSYEALKKKATMNVGMKKRLQRLQDYDDEQKVLKAIGAIRETRS